MENKLGLKKWLSFILAGFVGQLAWAIENNYFNVYVFDCTHNYDFITWMVIASAATATITTLLMGAVSDSQCLFFQIFNVSHNVSIFW